MPRPANPTSRLYLRPELDDTVASLLRGLLAVYHRRCKMCGAPATRFATFSFRGSTPQGFERLACDDDAHLKPHNALWVFTRARDTEQAELIRASLRELAATISG